MLVCLPVGVESSHSGFGHVCLQ